MYSYNFCKSFWHWGQSWLGSKGMFENLMTSKLKKNMLFSGGREEEEEEVLA
jgi:hypothetical protein